MNLLQETKEAFQAFKSSVVVAMQYLHRVKETEQWKEKSETWSDYVRDELDISQSFASKLLTVNRHYLIEGGLSPENIDGLDYEKLYIAQQTVGTLEEQLAKAKTLTRRELKEERNDDQPHEHEPITICKKCSIRL